MFTHRDETDGFGFAGFTTKAWVAFQLRNSFRNFSVETNGDLEGMIVLKVLNCFM